MRPDQCGTGADRAQMHPGDRAAIEEFEQFLADRKAACSPINVRDLWYRVPQDCDCPPGWEDEELAFTCPHDTFGGWDRFVFRGVLPASRRMFVTDRRIVLFVDDLAACTDMPAPSTLSRGNVRTVQKLLVLAPLLEQRPDRWFWRKYVDAVEAAGYRIRPLFAVADTHPERKEPHGIVRPDGRVAGLLMPIADDAERRDDMVQVSR